MNTQKYIISSIFPYQSSDRVLNKKNRVRYNQLLNRWRKSEAVSRQVPTPQQNKMESQIQEIDSLEENDKHLEASVEQAQESVEHIEVWNYVHAYSRGK